MVSQGGRHDLHGDWTERQRRAAAVRSHIEVYGMNCPGYRKPAHPSLSLTADHVVPVAQGGDPSGPLAVLCRSCNSSKGKGKRESMPLPVVRSRDWLGS